MNFRNFQLVSRKKALGENRSCVVLVGNRPASITLAHPFHILQRMNAKRAEPKLKKWNNHFLPPSPYLGCDLFDET